jgi:DNA-binding NtrC family response regulator
MSGLVRHPFWRCPIAALLWWSMANPSALENLKNIPVDKLLDTALERMKRATLDELGAMLSGKATVVPSTDTLAEMILALPEKGSKVAAVENAVVLHALATSGGNVSAAARLLGVDRKALERKLARAKRAAKIR